MNRKYFIMSFALAVMHAMQHTKHLRVKNSKYYFNSALELGYDINKPLTNPFVDTEPSLSFKYQDPFLPLEYHDTVILLGIN